jgi:hypothetical protein
MKTMSKIESLAIDLYQKEQLSKEALNVFIETKKKYPCVWSSEYPEPHCHVRTNGLYPIPFSKWCDNCKIVRPIYVIYRYRAIDVGVARRKLNLTIKKYLLFPVDK